MGAPSQTQNQTSVYGVPTQMLTFAKDKPNTSFSGDLLASIWDADGVFHVHVLKPGKMTNSKRQIAALKTLKK